MCFGGSPKTPELPPTPAPSPVPMPANVEPVTTESQRAQRVKRLRQGILSTIRTTPAGVIGTGSDLNQGEGKKTLGA